MRKWSFLVLLAGVACGSLHSEAPTQPHRVVVLGGGIGGLTAALYAARAGMSPLVIEGDASGGAIAQSLHVQNWPGEIEISGSDFIEKVHKQAELSGSHFLREEVVSVDFSSRPFRITTRDTLDPDKTQQVDAQTCVIALGSSPRFLGVPGERGEDGSWLEGVSNCALCDGALFKNKTVAVIGGGDGAIVEAHYLSQLAKKVYIILRKENFRTLEEQRKQEVLSRSNVEVIYNTTVQEVKRDEEGVKALLIRNEKTHKMEELSVDGMFLAIGSTPNSDFFRGQLELDKLGYIVLEGDVETSVPGVFAVGDIADPVYRQAISAAADGMKAVYKAEKHLVTTALPLQKSTAQEAGKASSSTNPFLEIQNEEQFDHAIRQNAMPTLVDFYATWCPPCRAVSPYFTSLAQKMSGKITFLKVNVDAFPALSQRFRVSAMPSLLVFDRQGQLISKKVGSKEFLSYLKKLEGIETTTAAQLDLFLQKKR